MACIKTGYDLKKYFAFSMMELMVCLIAIAIMSAALVPAITKRSKQIDVHVNADTLRRDCGAFSSDCEMCYEDRCVICSKNCPSGQLNNDMCTCEGLPK